MSLRTLDVTKHMDKKGKFTYLSWSWAVDKLIEHHPDATWEVKRFPMMVWETSHYSEERKHYDKDTLEVIAIDPPVAIKNLVASRLKVPYMRTDTGYYVEVEVTIDEVSRSQVHPVLDHRNKPVDKPNAFDINTSIQRCLAKAIALHGLGLHIYAGEDLPPTEQINNDVKVDTGRVNEAVRFIRDAIDQDDPDITSVSIRHEWENLTNDERLFAHSMLKDKAPDCNKMYSTLLKEYLKGE